MRSSFAQTFPVRAGTDGPLSSVSVLSPDGRLIAAALGGDLYVVDLQTHKLVLRTARIAIALGFSPDGTRLWRVGQRSRVYVVRIR